MHLLLVNPNTSHATTARMVEIGQAVSADVTIGGLTAPFGAPLIKDETALEEAARATLALVPQIEAADARGVIVAAFGDPGLAALRQRLAIPVTGIAEAGMAEAATAGRRFAVVTTTPALVGAIAGAAARYGHDTFAGTWLTPGDPAEVMADLDRLVGALHEACLRACRESAAEAIVVGGGPLAVAARRLAGLVKVPLIEPVPAAVRLAAIRGMTRDPSTDRRLS